MLDTELERRRGMSKVVEFDGPRTAKIYIVGEAPGANEELEGKPFVGGAGRLLNRLLMEAGMVREECRVGNVMRVRPAGNDFKHFYADAQRRIPKQELIEGIVYLKEDIKRCNPNLVVALGNEPLRALTGEMGITNWRGSILFSRELGCKVIPTIHPAALLRSWKNVPLVMFDFKRIREEGKTAEYSIRNREFVLRPLFETVMWELDRLRKVEKVAFDVETDEKGHITAIAIAESPWKAVSIPFTNSSGAPYWRVEEEIEIWHRVKSIMEDEKVGKIAQNAQFDIIMFLINPYHIKVKGLVFDTMCGHHTVYPELAASEKETIEGKMKHTAGGGKGLGLLCSIYTRQPYYKHWGKSGTDEIFWKYNCMDAAVTYECAEVIEREMKEFGVFDFYHRLVHPLIPILLEMQMRGVRLDQAVRVQAMEMYEKETEEMTEKLNGAIGRVVNVMSPKQLKELLYDELNLPPQYKKGTTVLTTNEEALEDLAVKFNSPIFDLILGIRQNRKLIGTYLNDAGGEDGRMRCSYVIGGTETGRLSSRQSVFGSGTNLQNIPPGVCRKMFIPDEGKIFIEADLSQAEARVVAYLAEEERMIEVFEGGGDIHQLTADSLPASFMPSGSAYENVPNPRRLFAKKHVHAFNYGEGEWTFARRARIARAIAASIRNGYLDRFPKIKAWHLQIQRELGKSRTMTTPMGRKRTFFGLWGDQLFREAYAFVPQSTVADVLNLATIRLYNITYAGKYATFIKPQLMLQNHDAFVVQCHNDLISIDQTILIIKEAFAIPIYINGKTFTIPIEMKMGKSWGEMEKT
jgi:DNA polymerase-1